MEESEFFEQRKQEINQELQMLKDKFLDDVLIVWQRRMNEFTGEWNRLMNKKAEIDAKQIASDKLKQP